MPVLLSVRRPSNEAIAELLAASSEAPFSYAEVGATKDLMVRMTAIPGQSRLYIGTSDPGALEGQWGFSVPERRELAGYRVDGASADLGSGDEVFERGCEAVDAWRMFDLAWVQVHGSQHPAPGVTVAVVAHTLRLWVTNLARVVYVIDEPDRYGFAYGTLGAHAERGEELFAVARAPNGSVSYELRAFSRPQRWWSRVATPYVRSVQARFRDGSCTAMQRAVDGASP